MADTPHNPVSRSAPARDECLTCQLMLTDALDALLSPAEQRLFELHLQACPACADEYGEAQRGVASLEMLKTPRPEPRPELLSSILAQTSGLALQPELAPAMPAYLLPVPQPAGFLHRFGRILWEPRLLMTAAMAFCSVALTLSLTGVRLDQLHASDLGPSGARRIFYTAEAGVVRYYDNLRVVHVMESRVANLRENFEESRPRPEPLAPTPPKQPAQHEDRTPDQRQAPEHRPAGSSQLHVAPPTTRRAAPGSDPARETLLALTRPSGPQGDLL